VNTTVDHLVIAADTLEDGVAWCEATLGVTPGPGGRHAFMGTHNRLLNLSAPAWPSCYLEIIAIDPAAPSPGRPRWFALDARPPGPPALWHVVARTLALKAALTALRAAGQDPGEPIAASRESAQGLLRWQITVRADGRMGSGGALPTLIQWDGTHPADHLPASGLTLQSLSLRGLSPQTSAALGLLGVDGRSGTGPALSAALVTPRGVVELESGPW
jgi:hypothetical protein